MLTRKAAEHRYDQLYPTIYFADVTFTSVSQATIKSSRENTGKRVEFKNIQKFAVKEFACTNI